MKISLKNFEDETNIYILQVDSTKTLCRLNAANSNFPNNNPKNGLNLVYRSINLVYIYLKVINFRDSLIFANFANFATFRENKCSRIFSELPIRENNVREIFENFSFAKFPYSRKFMFAKFLKSLDSRK